MCNKITGGIKMTLKHEIDISKAVDDITNKVKSSIAGSSDEKEQDNLNYNEFRFRIKTVGGTDINIPGGFIGFMIGAIATKGIISAINALFKK